MSAEDLMKSIISRFEDANQLAYDSLQKNLDRQNRGLAGLPVDWDDEEDASEESASEPDSASPTSPSGQ